MCEFNKNPNPTKDQFFIKNKELLQHICQKANILPGDRIVEIGGGAGAVTEVLASTGNPITVIELDHYYAELLKEKFRTFSNVNVIEGNALNHNYLKYERVVANLPYTITEPFLINLAKSGALYVNSRDPKSSGLKSITLVVSQNSARKMVAPIQVTEGKSRHLNSEFGLISAICQTYLEVDVDISIPSSAFYPEPATTSFLVNLVPKKKKTTVDRIMGEILLDRTERNPSIERVYQTMIAQGKVYKTGKHKDSFVQRSSAFTSKIIRDSNVYDLTNAQISQLIKDLIRNDSNMKGARVSSETGYRNEDLSMRFTIASMYECEDDFEDGFEEDDVHKVVTKWQKKSEETYAYLYDETRYNVLLHRGLEFLNTSELKQMLVSR